MLRNICPAAGADELAHRPNGKERFLRFGILYGKYSCRGILCLKIFFTVPRQIRDIPVNYRST